MFDNPIWWLVAIILVGVFDWLIYEKFPDFIETVKEGLKARKVDKLYPRRLLKEATKTEVQDLEKELGHKTNDDVYMVVDEEKKK